MNQTGKTILTAFDNTAHARRAFKQALHYAHWKNSPLHVLAVIHTPELHEDEARDRIIEKFREQYEQGMAELRELSEDSPVTVSYEIVVGHPVDVILERIQSGTIEHVFMGRRGRKGFFENLLMGSVSKRIADFASCTVTIVH